jgi:hypothetical protein
MKTNIIIVLLALVLFLIITLFFNKPAVAPSENILDKIEQETQESSLETNNTVSGVYGAESTQEVVLFGKIEPIPSDWEVIENIYKTAAQENNGEPGMLVGYTLKPQNSDSEKDSILIGGFQTDSCNQVINSRCNEKQWGADSKYPVYTYSSSSDILSFFNIFAY